MSAEPNDTSNNTDRLARLARLVWQTETGRGDVPTDAELLGFYVRRFLRLDRPASAAQAEEFNGGLLLDRLVADDHEHDECGPVGILPVMQTEVGEFHWRGGLTFQRRACGCVRIRSWTRDDDNERWGFRIVATIPSASWESVVREARPPESPNHD